jgi:hypothetical protein
MHLVDGEIEESLKGHDEHHVAHAPAHAAQVRRGHSCLRGSRTEVDFNQMEGSFVSYSTAPTAPYYARFL